MEFKFPDVGEGIHEGRIVKWRVSEGESVKADQPVAEVETDKAIVEIPSPVSGTVVKKNYFEGDIIKVGEVLVIIEESRESTPRGRPPAVAQPRVQPELVQQETRSSTQKPAQPQTAAKTTATKTEAEEGEKTGIDKAGGRLEDVPETLKPMLLATRHGPEVTAPVCVILATPATRKLARDLGVDLAKVTGTGPGGRILDDDVRRFISPKPLARTTSPGELEEKERKTKEWVGKGEEEIRIPLSGLRKVIAERMTYSKTHIPHACGMDFADVTKLVDIREKEKEVMEKNGIKLTYLPFVVKACVIALRRYPSFNANFDESRYELVAKKAINIGFAVDTPDGLMAPVIKNADKKSISEIAQEIERLAKLARERKIELEDMKGGTFTITNIGSVGGFLSTPIINPPEVAILGIHRIRDMPLVVDGRVLPRKVMGLSICFDHRVMDGAIPTEFMNTIKQHLEDPGLMLVDVV